MKRKEIRHYIGLNLKVYKSGGIPLDIAIENIINAVCDSWFFSWNSFVFGLIVGCVLGLISINL